MSGRHRLVLPDGVAPADVEALAVSRFPGEVRRADPQQLALPHDIAILGPQPVDEPLLPRWAALGYAFDVAVERGDPVPAELRGRGGLLDAFADGEPIGAERVAIELALAMARRLGGAVQTADGAVLRAEPSADLVLYSEVWLHPDALVHVLQPVLPGIALQGEERRTPLPPDAVVGLRSPIADDGARRWLHAEAAAFDAAALAEPPVTESYGALLRSPDGAVYSVVVDAALTVPPVLGDRSWSGVMTYEVRCHPAPENPVPADAAGRIDTAAAALLTAIGGVVVDDDGFLVDLG